VVRNLGLEFPIQHGISEDVRGLNFLGAKQAAEKLVGAVILSMDSRKRLSVMSETGRRGVRPKGQFIVPCKGTR
jgi:pimeloyl-CoA synthetase